MRNLEEPEVDRFRVKTEAVLRDFGSYGDAGNGIFVMRSPVQSWVVLSVMAASGEGWDHVSVSTRSRTPFWEEMAAVKDLFFKPDELVVQLHAPAAEHINVHPYCLHLWRPHFQIVPTPPAWMVG